MATQAPQVPTQLLEQRIFELLQPFRDECYSSEDALSSNKERKALILCENVAFIIRHNQSSYGKIIVPDDLSIASRNWSSMIKGVGVAGLGIFVNANVYSNMILRTSVARGDGVVDKLTVETDKVLQNFFPDV
ncbi:hypothetical protein EJ02DRAFT_404415 [Clathrospora elynae]|uniref:Uncharacterized protein n=1 Tax=Clathrospora elynae TaxID=706981 RepID=A0A6A5SPK7_9PLEO|nr:hypothetical protein EJ02DRAFT_404415 [Clathrospora elynae]